MSPSKRPNWFALVILAFGLTLVYGGYSTYRDQHSGTAGTAKVTECEGGTGTATTKTPVRCRGSWQVGGPLVGGDGQVVTGPVDGADHGHVGETVEVRIHGTDRATVPSLGTSIMFLVLGLPVAAFGVIALRSKPAAPPDARA